MATTVGAQPTWYLFRNSGEARPRASLRTNVVTTVLSVWFTLGLFLDAYAHANFPQLESFFTPWHAVFYSGFAATAGWILWTVWTHVQQGRRGVAAVPAGYGMTMMALPVFAVSGGIDLVWHEVIGIETTTDIFFSPSHLGLIGSMVVILTSPLRAAWADPDLPARPSLRALLPSVLTLSFAASLVLLFLTYGNALLFSSRNVVAMFSSVTDNGPGTLATRIVLTNLVLLAPLLVIARRWHLPFGTATIAYTIAALISAVLMGFELLTLPVAIVVAGVLVDLLAVWLRPSADRRAAFWIFGAAAPLVTWAVYLGAASLAEGALPAVVEFWTGMPVIVALLGWTLAALMLPNAIIAGESTGSERAAATSG
ncbi:hypothetical protein [Pseudonocardia xinjiangensis]|uniref:Uncharacterized protein n=1 Tax=Pseudonocardia xinjiangensis TaxID=75289 RepID=A0ABX1RGY2_9PSEU|nr:hypothetical protein [Pseudonocardia xinjiangensis]NMH79647.1 hypothetical protein [Pseudonocardia xinjiangensis]